MLKQTRRTALGALASLALVACGGAGNGEAPGSSPTSGSQASESLDMVLGAADAPVTLIEYASWTCGACLQFHNDVVSMLKTDYIETGKVRLVFREFPTAPTNVSVAGFAIARCSGADTYFDVIDELFDRQSAVLSLVRSGGQVKQALVQIAMNNGIGNEAELDACLQDEGVRRAISTAVGRGDAMGVSATPTLFLNGDRLDGFKWRSADGMREVLDEALGVTAESSDTGAADD
jgi:protein-disulfide isomerase